MQVPAARTLAVTEDQWSCGFCRPERHALLGRLHHPRFAQIPELIRLLLGSCELDRVNGSSRAHVAQTPPGKGAEVYYSASFRSPIFASRMYEHMIESLCGILEPCD